MALSGRSNTHTSRKPNRGGIHKQNSGPRVDRDGDLIMGGTPATRGARGRGRGGRSTRQGLNNSHAPKGPALDLTNGTAAKAIQQAIAQNPNSHGPARGARNNFNSTRNGGFTHDKREGLDEISVIGLQDSVAVHNPGGGSSDLITWLGHKASRGGEHVKVNKVC